MDFAEQIRVLTAAAGDPARLALASIDFAFPQLSEAERAALKETLEAVAIPHWYDEDFLKALLEMPAQECATRLVRLRDLTVTETFRARGFARLNVHQAARLAIRRQLNRDQPGRFLELSQRAASWFGDNTTSAARIEWVYHLLCGDSERGADECHRLDQEWLEAGEVGNRLALAFALNELETSGLLNGRARAEALACINHARAAFGKSARAEIDGSKVGGDTLTTPVSLASASVGTPEKRFAVALSYAGEQRDYVSRVVFGLRRLRLSRESIFYDQFHERELISLNMDAKLQRIYHEESELIAVFISADYETKSWRGLEWRAIRDIIKARKDDEVLPLRFDDTAVPGLFSIDGYVDLRDRDPEEVAAIIFDRVRQLRAGRR